MLKCSSPPSRKLSKHAPLIHVMKVNPHKVNAIIGTGGKKVKSIIDETGVEAIEARDDGIVKITARDLLSLEKSKGIIASLTMVPKVGDIYRNCEIKSIAPYGVFVEIAPGREGLCHISELSSSWLAKAEDIFKVVALVAGSNIILLAEQVKTLKPQLVAIRDESLIDELKKTLADSSRLRGRGRGKYTSPTENM